MPYQYAVKVVQGVIENPEKEFPLGWGRYFTSVNVHNPWKKDVKFKYKLAIAGTGGKQGEISKFFNAGLGNDGVTEFDHIDFNAMINNLPPYFEGYFVIISEEFELDVVGVYTGHTLKDKYLGAMHMERVPFRKV